MDEITIFWIIYSIGFIMSYIMCKKLRNNYGQNEWIDIIITIIFSLFSWAFVTGTIMIFIIKNIPDVKPPKWM